MAEEKSYQQVHLRVELPLLSLIEKFAASTDRNKQGAYLYLVKRGLQAEGLLSQLNDNPEEQRDAIPTCGAQGL